MSAMLLLVVGNSNVHGWGCPHLHNVRTKFNEMSVDSKVEIEKTPTDYWSHKPTFVVIEKKVC
jgi:hypothetical protein